MKKLTLFILALVAYNSPALHAYSWPIKNNTNKTLLIQVELLGSENSFFNIAKPGQTVDFSWPAGNGMAGFSINKIKYVIVDDYLLQNATFLTKDKSAVENPRTAMVWLNKNANLQRYPRLSAAIGIRHMKPGGQPGQVCFFASGGASINYSCPFVLVERKDGEQTIMCAETPTQSLKDLWCSSAQNATTGMPANN